MTFDKLRDRATLRSEAFEQLMRADAHVTKNEIAGTQLKFELGQHMTTSSARAEDSVAAPSALYVARESVKLQYQHAWLMSLIVGVCASSFTAYMFASDVDTTLVCAWWILINSAIGIRVYLIASFLRRPPPVERYRSWGSYFVAASWATGLAWGLPALVLDSGQLTIVFFYTLVIGGFVAGAIPGLSFNMRAFYGFAALAAVPLIVRLLSWEDAFFRELGVLSLLFVLINTASARTTNTRIKRQIALEYENRRLVERLQAERDRAEHANEIKTRFLAAASHDLRQPLHAIGLFVDALDSRIRFPEVRRIMDNLKLSTQHLGDLLNSLLDLSRLDAGVLKPETIDINLGTLLRQLTVEFEPQAVARRLEWRCRTTNAWVRSDPIMLTRILRNLLSNAIRYTQTGGVLIGCRRRGNAMRIQVTDTGSGIAPDRLEHVFEEFYQIDNPERDRDKGLGLGLAIVRRLANLLQHPIGVSSRVGRGSTFSVTVAMAPATPPQHAQSQILQADLAGALVVIVDDDASIRNGMSELLRSWGCETVLADGADGAVAELETLERSPSLIIADYRLREGKTGLQAIATIRALAGCDVPAILVTGDIAPERVQEAKSAGHRLLHKPVSAASLRSLAGYLIERAPIAR